MSAVKECWAHELIWMTVRLVGLVFAPLSVTVA